MIRYQLHSTALLLTRNYPLLVTQQQCTIINTMAYTEVKFSVSVSFLYKDRTDGTMKNFPKKYMNENKLPYQNKK